MSHHDQEKDLDIVHTAEEAVNDWKPDTDLEKATLSTDSIPFNPEGGSDYVTFIETPFEIHTLEISDAQKMGDELELDEMDSDLDDEMLLDEELPPLELNTDDSTLQKLAVAMEQETAKIEAAMRAVEEVTQEDRDKELAAQIAEDKALTEQMARENAEAEQALDTDPELLAALPKDVLELQSCIETLLFMMDKPISTKRLIDLLGSQLEAQGEDALPLFEQALQALKQRFASPCHGIELVEIAHGYQLRTKQGRAALAKKLAKIQTQRLSTGAMETLAIVAYRQPALKEEIDKIRGVDSSYFVRTLLDRKLISISGRSELPGRPMLYSTTDHFLELFGLKDLAQMPSLRELEQMVPSSQTKNPDDPEYEDPRIKQMRKLVGEMKADTSTSLLYDPREDDKILKEIRERVQAIPTSTPYLDEQKAIEKAAKQLALQEIQPELTAEESSTPGIEPQVEA